MTRLAIAWYARPMRSVKMWSGAWIAAMVSMAIGTAGGCAHGGSSGVLVTEYGYAVAGHGPSCHLGGRLPGSTGVWVMATPATAPPGAGIACTPAVMTVSAYEVNRPIREWRGQVYSTRPIPARGEDYLGFVNADSSIRWIGNHPGPIRVNTDSEGRGGDRLSDWLPGNATRVTVLVQHGHALGAGGGGYDGGTGSGGYGDGALDGGLGDTGPRGPSRARGGAGTDNSATRGRGARGHRGAGTSPTGTPAGDPRGGERASWNQPSSAELSQSGGRTPQPGGVEGGSAGGHGKPGDQGLSIGIGLWGVISVPISIAPLLETTALLAEAGVSPTALARKWLSRGLRVSGDRLNREIAKEAAELAVRQSQSIRAKLSRSADFARLSAAEQGRIIDAATDTLQREYLERLERVAAAEVSDLERGLARGTAPAAGTPAAHAERVARENLGAYERVRLAARQARADFRPRVRPPAARGTNRRTLSKAAAPLDPTKPAREVLAGSLKRKFPAQHLDKSLIQIKAALKSATSAEKKSLQTAKKLLEQQNRLLQKAK